MTAPTQYGPRARAAAVYAAIFQHVPVARNAVLLSDLLGAPVSGGSVPTWCVRAAEHLGPFETAVRARLHAAPVVHFDETGVRVDGRLHWLHTASTASDTLYALHTARGTVGVDAAGVLPAFRGVAVHDGFTPYRKYPAATHALCNAHHLRELQGVIDHDPAGAQTWAVHMDQFLRVLHIACCQARDREETRLDPRLLRAANRRYTQILRTAARENPQPTPTGRRGRPRRTVAGNLAERFRRDRDHVLLFANDLTVPFDNNQAERDLRMAKLQQKISGCWRTPDGAHTFLRLRAYLSTASKHRINALDALTRLIAGDPWIPAPT